MPIKINITSPSMTRQDAKAVIEQAFASASYPVKVKITNLTDARDTFPDVLGIVTPPHVENTNEYALSKRIEIASADDLTRLSNNILTVIKDVTETGELFVIQEIDDSSTLDQWPFKLSKKFERQFNSLADLQAAINANQLQDGIYRIDGDLFIYSGGKLTQVADSDSVVAFVSNQAGNQIELDSQGKLLVKPNLIQTDW